MNFILFRMKKHRKSMLGHNNGCNIATIISAGIITLFVLLSRGGSSLIIERILLEKQIEKEDAQVRVGLVEYNAMHICCACVYYTRNDESDDILIGS